MTSLPHLSEIVVRKWQISNSSLGRRGEKKRKIYQKEMQHITWTLLDMFTFLNEVENISNPKYLKSFTYQL